MVEVGALGGLHSNQRVCVGSIL